MAILLLIGVTAALSISAVGALALRVGPKGMDTAMGGCGVAVIGPGVVLAYSGFRWLTTGECTSITVRDVVSYLSLDGLGPGAIQDWTGFQRLNEIYFDSDIIWSLIGVPLVVFFVFTSLLSKIGHQ